jgi:hypothetical protein
MTTNQVLSPSKKVGPRPVDVLLLLGRGILAIVLGVAVLINHNATRMLGDFIGAYWIGAGGLSVIAGLRASQSRLLAVLVGLFAILAGVLMQTRFVWGDDVPLAFLTNLLGAVAVLTGILHAGGWMPVWSNEPGTRTVSGLLLGLFEIGLGVVLIAANALGPLVALMAIIWAFGGGLILIGEAIAMWRRA